MNLMGEPRTIKKVKEEIQDALATSKPDAGHVMKLAAELSSLDGTSAHFSVNATIIRRLGRELVASRETALAELIKNSYDADANDVTVTLSRLDKPGGRMHIKDDGSGMTVDQLRNGFLQIASDYKEREPESPGLHRKRAGQKGIGRFAVERLGKKLTLITATKDSQDATQLTVDWDNFERSGELFSVRSPITRTPKTFPKGTLIIIDDLREGWTIDSVNEAQTYVVDLLQPKYFDPPSLPGDAVPLKESELDPNRFDVSFNVLEGASPVKVHPPERQFVESALAIVDASVDATGEWKIAIDSKLLKKTWKYDATYLPDEEKKDWLFTDLKNVRLRAAYYIWDDEVVESLGLKNKKTRIRARVGLKVYRNGFRVSPYGNPGNDWLGLDQIAAKRKILPAVGNKSWLGFISITDPSNSLIVETSSREGLVESRYYTELRDFAQNVLVYCAIVVARKRKKKVYASDKDTDFGESRAKKTQKTVQRLSKQIRELAKTRETSKNSYTKDVITDTTLEDVKTDLEVLLKDTTELTSEIAILRTLASVGMSVLMFSHEVKGVLVAMLARIQTLLNEGDINKKTRDHLAALKVHIEQLQHHTGYYEATGSAAASREKIYADMLASAHTFVATFKQISRQASIDLSFEGDLKLGPRLVAIHEAEFAGVLINLYTNAFKAIKKKSISDSAKIVLRHSRIENRDILEFMDNGVGIKEKDRDRVFEPFFTTSAVRTSLRPADPDIYGTGLGLTITRDSIRSGNGTIAVVIPPPPSFSTCLRIEMPHVSNES